MTEREAYIGFTVLDGVGPQRFKLLVDYFGTAVSAWQANGQILIKIGLGEKLTRRLLEHRAKFNPQLFEQQLLVREIKIITRIDHQFPKLLKEI